MNVLIFCLIIYVYSQKLSSHQISGYDINLKYENILGIQKYLLSLVMAQYDAGVPQIIYCFKKMQTIPQQDLQNCDLIQQQSQYRCIQIKYADLWDVIDTITDQQWDSYWQNLNQNLYTTVNTFYTFSKQKGIIQDNSFSTLVNISFQKQQRIVNFTGTFFQQRSIYHMITAQSRDILLSYDQGDKGAKLNYIHTYVHPTYSDTLIVQRNYNCILYKNKTVYIFQGAVDRSNLPHFFTGILTVDQYQDPFDMWGGYSYSSSHAARDMMAYESNTKSFYDLYSLYAAAPFQDISSNINGQKNVVRIGNSGSSSSEHAYHFIQFYRLFDTGDSNGDQIIRQKIYNKFCFAAYFTPFNINTTSSINFTVLSNNFKHELIDCHIPILSIYENWLRFNLIMCLYLCYFLF